MRFSMRLRISVPNRTSGISSLTRAANFSPNSFWTAFEARVR